MKPFAQWIEEEVSKESKYSVPFDSPAQSMMLEFWRIHRPIMYRALKKKNLHRKLAKVLEQKALEQIKHEGGNMPYYDRREQAERDWYLMEPEEPNEYPKGECLLD